MSQSDHAPDGQALAAFEAFASSLKGVHVAESRPDVTIDAARRREPDSMPSSIQPTVPGATNWCGQAAAWSVIRYWGKQGGMSDQDLIDDLYRRFGPDFLQPFVNAGTTPPQIAAALQAYGLRTQVVHILKWDALGFSNPINQPGWHVYRSWIEDSWINRGFPAIALMDSGGVGGPGFNLHWVVCSSAGSGTARVHNYLGGGYHSETMNLDRFHEAWEVRFLPFVEVHFAAVLVQP